MDAFEKPTLVYRNGVHLQGTMVWFDPTRASEFCAVSSAAQPRLNRHQRVLWSDRTAQLIEHLRGFSLSGLACPFRHAFNLGPLVFELIPSGYMPGACQYMLRFPSGHELLYSGPFSLQDSRTAEIIEYGACDTLLLDATYGDPSCVFPDRPSVWEDIQRWIDQTHGKGHVPVVLASNPGKAQDLIQMLGPDAKIRAPRAVRQLNAAYRAVGVDIPVCHDFRGEAQSGDVVVWPKNLANSPVLKRLRQAEIAVATGVVARNDAALQNAKHFPWSGRADFPDLLKYVQAWQPSMVLTVGRHATTLARKLSAEGLRATPLLQTVQMPLDF